MTRALRVACWCVCLMLASTAARAAQVTAVEVIEYGLYTYDEKIMVVEERQNTSKLSNIRLLKETLDIPKGEKTFFGIKYVLKSPGKSVPVDIELRVTPPGGKASTGSMQAYTGVPTVTNIEFGANDPPGTYLFQVLQQDRVLLSRKINLINP